jgi:hypothetical protein
MTRQKTEFFKWLPLAAIGMLFPTAYIWLFLWCLKLNVSFWMIYTVLYGGAIASSFWLTSRQAQSRRAPVFKEFTRSQPQAS